MKLRACANIKACRLIGGLYGAGYVRGCLWCFAFLAYGITFLFIPRLIRLNEKSCYGSGPKQAFGVCIAAEDALIRISSRGISAKIASTFNQWIFYYGAAKDSL